MQIYKTTFNGKAQVVKAEDLHALKEYVLTQVGFTHKRASGADVSDHVEAGGKIITATVDPA